MFLTQIKFTVAALLALGVVATGMSLLAFGPGRGPSAAAAQQGTNEQSGAPAKEPAAEREAPAPEKEPPTEQKVGFANRKPLKAGPKDDELRKLQIERYNEALEEARSLLELVLRGAKTPNVLSDAHKRIAQSGLEVYDKPEDRIALLTDYIASAKAMEQIFKAQFEAGRVAETDMHHATYYRIDAEIQLLKAKRAAEKPKDK